MRKVIDAHTHIDPPAIDLALRIMDQNGIEAIVDLKAEAAGRLDAALEAQRNYPDRLIVFGGVDFEGIGTPGFGQQAAAAFEASVGRGVRGLKINKRLGLHVRDTDDRLVPIDDDRLGPVWAKAGELGVPVLIHTGDPKAFFEPLTPDNERYDELSLNPTWSFADRSKYPPREELLQQRDRLLGKQPGTTFIGAHFGSNPEDIDYVADCMRKYPNFVVDMAARVGEIGRHNPDKVRNMFVEFQNRILFGTDLAVSHKRLVLCSPSPEPATEEDIKRGYDAHWQFLETNDRNIEHPAPIQGNWTVNAIGLDQEVLHKVYYENARRLLQQ